MSSADRLVYMANQIGDFFSAQPGEAAARQIADHINAFWDPSMRRAMLTHLEAGGAGLKPDVLAAVRLIRPPASP